MSTSSFQSSLSRRALLNRLGGGFGAVGLAGAFGHAGLLGDAQASVDSVRKPHVLPRAKRVIFLFMNGGPSHVDTFDPKPALKTHAGERPAGDNERIKQGSKLMPSPFTFRRHGESGIEMSELFPRLAEHADDLCMIRSMHTDTPNHEPSLLMMNSGRLQPSRPSMGSWLSYGLGSDNENLPSFVVLSPGRPVVGPQLWSNGFLPGEHQATAVDTNDLAVDKLVANLRHPQLDRTQQRRQLDLLASLNRRHLEARNADPQLETQIRAMELAYKMQAEASVAFDVSREPQPLRESYGQTPFGQSCLLARRLVEHGVRFVQVYYVQSNQKQPWDTHADNDNRHRTLCADSDRATAALLSDLKARGLLEDTLVIWGGEFGRTPYAQIAKKGKAKPGRDHHNTAFTMFLAGGGSRSGYVHGATDDFGMLTVDQPVHVHDFHATLLHLMGLDHTRLTYHYSGRDFRLTDIHGEVVRPVVA